MTNDYCKQCVFWIFGKCLGLEVEGTCPDVKLFENWYILDSCIEDKQKGG